MKAKLEGHEFEMCEPLDSLGRYLLLRRLSVYQRIKLRLLGYAHIKKASLVGKGIKVDGIYAVRGDSMQELALTYPQGFWGELYVEW